jgi:hypothetical protein
MWPNPLKERLAFAKMIVLLKIDVLKNAATELARVQGSNNLLPLSLGDFITLKLVSSLGYMLP